MIREQGEYSNRNGYVAQEKLEVVDEDDGCFRARSETVIVVCLFVIKRYRGGL